MARLAQFMPRLADFVFGGTCVLCRGGAREILCAACAADLPRLAFPQCPRCALGSPRGEPCGRCLAHPPSYDATHAALAYRFPADVLVHALKFRGELALSHWLGELLATRIGTIGHIDRVVPVPLSGERLRERGFNQSMEIARPVAAALGAKLDALCCIRRRDTRAQTDLAWGDRASNVRDAFCCATPLEGASVAVVDDVMTTGATLEEVARALKRAGAGRVVNCVVARTAPPGDNASPGV